MRLIFDCYHFFTDAVISFIIYMFLFRKHTFFHFALKSNKKYQINKTCLDPYIYILH